MIALNKNYSLVVRIENSFDVTLNSPHCYSKKRYVYVTTEGKVLKTEHDGECDTSSPHRTILQEMVGSTGHNWKQNMKRKLKAK